jgi:hypothetical protein
LLVPLFESKSFSTPELEPPGDLVCGLDDLIIKKYKSKRIIFKKASFITKRLESEKFFFYSARAKCITEI